MAEMTPAQQRYEAWVRSKEHTSMPDTPTPGETAYAAYCASWGNPDWIPAWETILPESHRAWEAAAEAVREVYKEEWTRLWLDAQEGGQYEAR